MKIHKVRVIASVIALLLAEILLTGFSGLGPLFQALAFFALAPTALAIIYGLVYAVVKIIQAFGSRQVRKPEE